MKTIGLITGQPANGFAIVTTVTADNNEIVKWENVSPAFKEEFLAEWKDADDILNGDFDTNAGMNMLSVLDTLGAMVNEGEVGKDEIYEEARKRAVQHMIEEMHKS